MSDDVTPCNNDIGRQVAWDVYAAGVLSMSHHPGTTRDKPNRMTVQEIAAIADAMLAERDRRFKENTNG